REHDLDRLDEAHEPRLVDLVRQLAGRGREQEERSHEDRGAQVDERIRRERPGHGPEREQDDERVPEDVVVERAEELGPEEGTEAAKAQESEPADGRHRSRYQTHRRDEVQRAPEARRLPRRGRSGVARTGMAGDPRRILLVDDDLESRTALSELFGVWGYE